MITCEIDGKNRIEEQFVSSHVFHRTTDGRVQKTDMGEQFLPQNLKSFDPMTQAYNHP
jgi:hypothetical protein